MALSPQSAEHLQLSADSCHTAPLSSEKALHHYVFDYIVTTQYSTIVSHRVEARSWGSLYQQNKKQENKNTKENKTNKYLLTLSTMK